MLLSHPSFQLFSATLYEVVEFGLMQKFLALAKKEEGFRKLQLNAEMVPVALRWTTHPEYGFPRQPFKVFRKPAAYSAKNAVQIVKDGNEAVTITRTFPFNEEMYVMAVSCTIPAGQSLLLTPLGHDNTAMKAKAYRMSASGSIIFKAPFMKGLLCEGLGWVNMLIAFPMQLAIQSENWEHIQTVGFPFASQEVQGQGYESDPQGFVGSEISGEAAGMMRLRMGESFFIPPNSVNAADSLVADVSWRHPRPEFYMKFLREQQLKMISNCLKRSDDFSWNRNERQISFNHKMNIPGIDQPGSGLPTKEANVVIPVVKHTVLSVSNESPAALGLGFGTYDFIPTRNAQPAMQSYSHMAAVNSTMVATPNFLGYDYMVTAQYVIRPFEEIKLPFLDDLTKQLTFCALNDERTRPVTPEELVSMGLQMNRPEQMDAPFTESVKLRWNQSNVPHGYGVVSSYKSGTSDVSNDAYEFQPNAYQSLFTPVPKIESVQQDLEDIGKYIYIGTDEPVPFYGSELHKYFVAGWDVFGRWSGWVKSGYTSVAPAPQKPGIMSISLDLAQPQQMHLLSPTNSDVPCKLVIEFGWDWIDRSPHEIQIAGRFFDAALNDAPINVPAGFALNATGSFPDCIHIRFASADPDILPTTSLGQIMFMTNEPPAGSPPSPPPPANPPSFGSRDVPSANLKRYKLIIENVTARFTNSAPHQVAYSAFIRGLERVRFTAPNGWSGWESGYSTRPDGTVVREGGYIARLSDPRPPAVTVLPATVLFTAVPDAAKIARGKLSWPAATGALTYNIFEASETAVRVALEEKLKTEFPSDQSRWLKPLSDPIIDRATQLRDLLAQAKYDSLCQRSFSRLSKDPIVTTSYELSLPGSSDGLFLYKVSSVNTANIESAKSNVVFFAVPKVITPAAPMLQVRTYKKKLTATTYDEGIEVKVLHTNGAEPAGYQLYRTRKRLLVNDPGMKGLPLLEHDDAAWQDATMSMLDGKQYSGKSIKETNLSRSWRPWVYQAVAIGKADAQRGRISGESDGSTTEIAYFPPEGNPIISLNGNAVNGFSKVFHLKTNAPFDKIEIGKTIIEAYVNRPAEEKNKISFVANETRLSNVVLGTVDSFEDAAQAVVEHKKLDNGTGMTEFSVRFVITDLPVLLRIIDPLGRAGEIKLEA